MRTANIEPCDASPDKKARKEARNTFGITGHSDIISAHLQARYLTKAEFLSGFLTESADRQKSYQLLLDYKTASALYDKEEVAVLVSFQVRKDGCYAVARLWNIEKRTTK